MFFGSEELFCYNIFIELVTLNFFSVVKVTGDVMGILRTMLCVCFQASIFVRIRFWSRVSGYMLTRQHICKQFKYASIGGTFVEDGSLKFCVRLK